jgi:dsDNA-binding SOS-regulon protein
MYAFGTKKGRDALKKMLSHSETIEENLNQIIDLIQNNIIDKKK